MNFFDRNPAGWHMSQFAPCPYIALIPIWESTVMTHTGSFLLKSTGFNIGDHIAIALMLESIYPVAVSTGRFSYFVLILIMVWYTPSYLACIVPGIVPVQGIFGLCYNFREFSIPWFAAFYLIQHVCHCHQWHVPDNQFYLRINQAWILTNRTVTLWVVEALSLCALYALGYSKSIWIYHLDIRIQIFWGNLRI